MDNAQLDRLFSWFDGYVEPFLQTDAEGFRNIQLKIEHTRKVCEIMRLLVGGECLSEHDANIAVATALLHDVGRFPQYRRWRTFRDSESDNHARLAIDVIRSEQLLEHVPPLDQLMIEEAVRFHNQLQPPVKIRSPHRRFINLIRDADKLDIWRVFVELLAQPQVERASAATLGLPDLPGTVSEGCVAALAAGTIVRLDTVTCVNDFTLLQISWVFDLTCATARRILHERGYIPVLAASLPERDDVRQAVSRALESLSA